MSGRQSSSYNYKVNFDSGIMDPSGGNPRSSKRIKQSFLIQ